MHTLSLGVVVYFLTFIDDFSRSTTMYFLTKKSKVLNYFQNYRHFVENQFFNHKILILTFDNGRKLISKAFNAFCLDYGIQCQLTTSNNLAQNRISKRKNWTLVEAARSTLHVARLPNSLWTEVVSIACYLQNYSYTLALPNITPYEL